MGPEVIHISKTRKQLTNYRTGVYFALERVENDRKFCSKTLFKENFNYFFSLSQQIQYFDKFYDTNRYPIK